MTTLAVMKGRIALELRRGDLTADIANAISTAIDVYKRQKFSFNTTTFVDAPASDGETGNAWMTTAEQLIRCRAKAELYAHVIQAPPKATVQFQLAEEALARLRMSVTNTTTATADTLGAMKLRIKNEINRSDLDDEIADAISNAIQAYDHERFYFSETREVTFNTVQGQTHYGEDHTTSPTGALGRLLHIDYLFLYEGGNSRKMIFEDAMETDFFASSSTNSAGTPCSYSWYGEKLVLDPSPSAVFPMRLGGVFSVAQPASDGETNNAWMMKKHAEQMIRNRAKAELYATVEDIADEAKARRYMAMAEDAARLLREKTEAKAGAETPFVAAWDPY